jgi:hypothetical protein
LLRDGARPRRPITGPFGHFLHLAAYYGRRDLVEFLVKAKADVNAIGKMLPLVSLKFAV